MKNFKLLQQNITKNRMMLQIIISVIIIVTASIFALYALCAPPIQRLSEVVTPDETSPYGFTVLSIFRQQTIDDLKRLHINWVRYQINWQDIEPQEGQFNWQELDAAVALANANSIHMSFVLQEGPDWAMSQVCAGRHFLPGPQEMAAYASAVAQRYNGSNGHGYIDSYEVGNEEYDSLWTGDWDQSIACREPSFYGPVLKAAYLAIKQASPQALVGMHGLWWVNTPHLQEYMTWLYQNQYGSYFDFANFHYYICNADPSTTDGDRPSFNLEWQTLHGVMVQYGDGDKPIWATEVGWNINDVYQSANCVVTPQQQSQYLLFTAQASMDSHVITHIFWYTIDRGNDGMSITQPTGNPPAFSALQNFIQQNPQWPGP